MRRSKTIAFDFDGVLHSYKSGWKGANVIPDPAVEGMASICHTLIDGGHQVFVMSSRANHPNGAAAMAAWLKENGFPFMKITNQKLPADLYVDDRAFRFRGEAGHLLRFIQGDLSPWNKGDQMPGTKRKPDLACLTVDVTGIDEFQQLLSVVQILGKAIEEIAGNGVEDRADAIATDAIRRVREVNPKLFAEHS